MHIYALCFITIKEKEGTLMKKNLSRILAAFLILCMLPAMFITAFARGKGVYGDSVENQSLNNAPGQYIPETINIDGILNDTGWPESGFNYVDSNTGYWNVEDVEDLAGKNADATYKYQIRSDIEQLYIGATLTLPELVDGQDEAIFHIFMKDAKNTSSNVGYTDTITFTVNVANKTATVVVGPGKTAMSTVENGTLPAEAHQFVSKFSTDAEGNCVVTLEMRNKIANMVEDISAVTYYVALYLPTGNITAAGNPEYNQLVHPKVQKDDGVRLPDEEYWPTDVNGNPGGKHVDTLYSTPADNLPYEVNVDGIFDESVWSTLTNQYIHGEDTNDYISLGGDTLYGTGVKYSTGSYIPTGTGNYGVASGYNSKDNSNRTNVSFKYEFRVDGQYLYGAVVAYVPPIEPYIEHDNGIDGGKDVWVYTSPDLNVYFFDDARGALEEYDFDQGKYVESEKEPKADDPIYNEILPASEKIRIESVLQIRSFRPDFKEGDRVYPSYANCWVDSSYNNLPYHIAWGNAAVDVNDKTQFEGSRSECQPGNLWNFEFKVALERIPKVDGDIRFSVAVYDRYSINRSGTSMRGCAYTGSANGQTYSQRVPQYNYGGNENNIITAEQIAAANTNSLDVANKNDFADKAELQQEIWAALSGADDKVDGRERTSTLSSGSSFAYKISADHEYIYGAAIVDGSWAADSYLKLWLNRKKTKQELESITYVDVDLTNQANYGGNAVIKNYYVEDHDLATYNDSNDKDKTRLIDGKYHTSDVDPSSTIFSAWSAETATANVILELSELFAVKEIDAFFSGGDEAEKGLWGVYIPNGVKVYWSVDGVTYSEVSSSLKKVKEYTDTVPSEDSSGKKDDLFHSYKYVITLDKIVSARYLKLEVSKWGNFLWMSELDVKITETHGEVYSLNIPIDTAANTTRTVKFYTIGSQNKDVTDANKKYIDYKVIDDNGKQKAIEFRISLRAFGIDLNLYSDDADEIFCYYVSVDNYNGTSGLAHPRNDSGRYPSGNWLMDKNYDGCNVFTYGDMLGDIRVDGKLDEKYWIGNGKDNTDTDKVNDTVEMIHVDSTKGTWESDPKYGNTLSYDYKIYAGENYLYGAAIIDVSAISSPQSFDYTGIPITRFDIWIDNKRDEYEWILDNADDSATNDYLDGTNTIVSVDRTGTSNEIPTYDKETKTADWIGFEDVSGGNGAAEYNVRYYTNYYYNIYLCDALTDGALPVASGSGDKKFVCGGCTPQWYNDPNKNADAGEDLMIPINETNFSWGMSTVNGKTYVEFMIDLDNFYCDRERGFNYYVTVTHTFDEGTAEAETLTLAYPAITDETAATEDLFVSHVNYIFAEGSGVILTKEFIDSCYNENSNPNENKYWSNTSTTWWQYVLLRPVNSNGDYKVIEIRDGSNNGKANPFRPSEGIMQNGDIVYGINAGNDFIYLKHEYGLDSVVPGTGIDLSKKEFKNYKSVHNTQQMERICKWTVGDVFKLTFEDKVNNIVNGADKTQQLTDGIQKGWNYDGRDNKALRTDLYWYEPAYIVYSKAGLVTKSEARKETERITHIFAIPSTDNWDHNNDASVKPLEHFAPEVIKIDGLLNEAGWDDDQWIYVIETANGTLEQVGGVAEELKYQKFFKYQLRTDGEYLYVGAQYPMINYADYNMPSFTLWIKSDSEANTWTHRYEIAYSEDGSVTLSETDTQIADDAYVIEGKTPVLVGPKGETTDTEKLAFANKLSFDVNGTKTPNGLNSLIANGEYGDSALYGYTEEVQENQTSGEYYPTIKTEKIYLGKESAVMKSINDDNNSPVVVEFKIALDEFNGANGFEYYTEAGYLDYDLFYPVVYVKPQSDENERLDYFPMWEWDSKNAAKVTVEDLTCGAMRMRNNCNPVVTLGAKISNNYIAPDDGKPCKAIRFGALYTEDYLRNWAKTDAASVDQGDEMYTASRNDYWDIAEVGIAVLPTMLLGEAKLTLETPDIFTAPADNIVDWQHGDEVEGGWSNFADYENFVFYITIWGIEGAEDMKFSFRPYVDFYASAGTDTYYGETFIRSYNMINDYAMSEEGTEEDTSKPVLPDSSENPPPAENHPQENN